jgi:hypothetical protein
MGVNPEQLVKTANWLGPLLVAAGLQQVPAILLFGYHGKLIKLAGGIFHTHHHLADGRLEILTAHCADLGLPTPVLRKVFASTTVEAALQYLRKLDARDGGNWVNPVYEAIASTIDARSQDYIRKHSEQDVRSVQCCLTAIAKLSSKAKRVPRYYRNYASFVKLSTSLNYKNHQVSTELLVVCSWLFVVGHNSNNKQQTTNNHPIGITDTISDITDTTSISQLCRDVIPNVSRRAVKSPDDRHSGLWLSILRADCPSHPRNASLFRGSFLSHYC